MTKPLPMGSTTCAKTIGIVRVCCRSAVVAGVFWERMSSGRRETISFANVCNRAASPSAHRASIARLSVQPSFWQTSLNAAKLARYSGSLSDPDIRAPMRRTRAACWLRALSGHARPAPPSRIASARRLTPAPARPGEECEPKDAPSLLHGGSSRWRLRASDATL